LPELPSTLTMKRKLLWRARMTDWSDTNTIRAAGPAADELDELGLAGLGLEEPWWVEDERDRFGLEVRELEVEVCELTVQEVNAAVPATTATATMQ
jgi:hypothetical protein